MYPEPNRRQLEIFYRYEVTHAPTVSLLLQAESQDEELQAIIYEVDIVIKLYINKEMPEHRTQFAFKGKREYIVKISIPNLAYLNQLYRF